MPKTFVFTLAASVPAALFFIAALFQLIAIGAALTALPADASEAHLASVPADESTHVDMLLCLAADVSESVTDDEYELQREGHAAAIVDPQVVKLIENGPRGRIGVLYMEWARQDQQFVSADWQIVEDTRSAKTFAQKIRTSPMPPWIEDPVRNTSTGEAVRFCLRQFQSSPFHSKRLVIDISSDGTSNIGLEIAQVRDEAVSQGVVINALAIVDSVNPFPNPTHTQPEGGLIRYFETNVVGGNGSFVTVARGYASFSKMIKRKFLQELASAN